MCTYLDKVGSTYYFRHVVPAELRPFIRTRTGAARKEWKVSLGTKDRDTAKRAISPYTMTTDAEIDLARLELAHGPVQNAPERPAGRVSAIVQARAEMSLEAAEIGAAEVAGKEARREDVAELVDFLKQRLRGSTREMPRKLRAIAYLLEDIGFDRDTLREHLQIARGQLRQLNQPQPDVIEQKPTPSASAVPLLEAFDAYAKEQQLKPGTAYEWRTNIAALVRFLGHDDAAQITVEDLDRWRDHLLSETTKRGQLRTARTVKDKYLSSLRATLNWLVEKRRLKSNVAAEVIVRVPRRAKLRDRNFTTDEANSILAATLQPSSGDETAHTLLARRWIPWLCAYTGARVNEISQLRGSDVTQIGGIWTVRITPEAGTVKADAARIVPLHSHLVEQGFPAVAGKAGDAPIFYDVGKVRKPGAANRHVKKVGERLALWVREDVGINDPNIQPNHGWRHTFKTLAMEAEIPERVADAIQGHAPRSVGQTYGSVSLATLAREVEKLPRFKLKEGQAGQE